MQITFNLKDSYMDDLHAAILAKFGDGGANSTNDKRLKFVIKSYLMRILADYRKVKIEQELLADTEGN